MQLLGRRNRAGGERHSSRCNVHPFESGEGSCGQCREQYCGECLVYPFGAHKAPLCINCALVAGGIRPPMRKAAFG
jgi:hypothetical protein